jgi:hypothetical protein
MPTTFNTTDPKPGYVYDAATDTWFPLLGIAPGSSVVRWRKTAVGAETSVSGLDDLGATLAYNAGTEQVYLNGVLLVRTEDYLATTGTSITGLTALAASDVIEVISFNATNVQITDALLETDINAKGDLIVGAAVDTAAILTSGTNGQVLSVNTATATGLEWVTSDDANAIQNAIVNAKGDLISASADNTPAILTVGNNGETLVADSAATVGLRYSATPSASNPVINSAFQIGQRGTSFSLAASASFAYTLDRWYTATNANQACVVSRVATGDTTNLPNIQYALRYQRNSGQTGTGNIPISQSIETVNSIPYAGKTVTYSFYARKGANFSPTSSLLYTYLVGGTGTDQNVESGFTGQTNIVDSTATLTTTWQRFTFTGTVGSTITELATRFVFVPTGTAGAADYFEITGVQVDIGSVALPFRTNGATIQGELAACQRYYYQTNTGSGGSSSASLGAGWISGTTEIYATVPMKQTMRVAPTFSSTAANTFVAASQAGSQVGTAISAGLASVDSVRVNLSAVSLISGNAGAIQMNANASANFQFSAEL